MNKEEQDRLRKEREQRLSEQASQIRLQEDMTEKMQIPDFSGKNKLEDDSLPA